MSFKIPPLQSGGVMLTYRCDNACRHCHYSCSPKCSDAAMSETMIDRTMSALSKERRLDGIHFGGGEATLYFDRLIYATKSARQHDIRLDYLETNGRWCVDDKTALEGFTRLREAGLPGVLISASLFHLEFIPPCVTKTAIKAANQVFGGAFVWTEEVLRLMNRLPDADRTYTLKESCQRLGVEADSGVLWQIHSYLTPGGRAARRLAEGVRHYPAKHFEGDCCTNSLSSTWHFHIDPYGNLFTGHCPGIAVASVDNLHPAITAEEFPFYMALLEGGPILAWRRLAPEFELSDEGYIGKCHFCLELRRHLLKQKIRRRKFGRWTCIDRHNKRNIRAMSKDQKIKFPEVTAEEMQQSLQKDCLHLRALLFLKVVAVAVLINALFFLVTYLNGTFHPKQLLRGWYYGSYSNVPCILPEKLAGTWGIDNPYYEAVFCSLPEEMRNWKEIKLVLNKDGSFVFMNPPSHCLPYQKKKDRKEGDCVVLHGQWGLHCRIESQDHWKHEYYCTFLRLKCDGEDEHAYVGMLLESDSP